jgi:hypothetical protein
MKIELIEEAYAAKNRIEKNTKIYNTLAEAVFQSCAFSPMERQHQFGQDFCNLVIGDGADFRLDLSRTGCNSAIIEAILGVLKDKIEDDAQFIADL